MTGNSIRKPPDCTGNDPTPDLLIGHSGQDINIQNDKHMSSEMNMLIMYHVQHLSTVSTSKITSQASPII